jgi:hypothetical protein
MAVQPALQNQNRRHAIDNFFSSANFSSGGIQMAVSLGGAHPFVPQVDRHAAVFAQSAGKFLRGLRSRAAIAGQMNGPADDNCGATMAPNEARDASHIVLIGGVWHRQERLRRESKLVGDRDSDSSLAGIDAQNANGDANGDASGCG